MILLSGYVIDTFNGPCSDVNYLAALKINRTELN